MGELYDRVIRKKPAASLTGSLADFDEQIASMQVTEILAAVREGRFDVGEVVAAEGRGKGRKTILQLAG